MNKTEPIDISLPQRQAKLGLIVLTLISAGKSVKNWWFFLIYFLIKSEDNLFPKIAGLVFFIFIVSAIFAIIKYYTFYYSIDTQKNELIIKQGFFQKKMTHIDVNSIQEVNINQPFLHKFLRIYQLEINALGSSDKELSIQAIDLPKATLLKNYILAEKKIKEQVVLVDQVSSTKNNNQFKISITSLVKYGLTANYAHSFFALIGFIFYFGQQIKDYAPELLDQYLQEDKVEAYATSQSWIFYTFIFILFFIIAVFLHLVRTVIKYGNFKGEIFPYYLSLEYGLLNTKNSLVSDQKVQLLSVTQNAFQKLLNISKVSFYQVNTHEEDKDKVIIPSCPKALVMQLKNKILGEFIGFKIKMKPSFRKTLPAFIFGILIPIIVCIFVYYYHHFYSLWYLIYLGTVTILILKKYAKEYFETSENHLLLQKGIWEVEQIMIEKENVQSITFSQYIWHRKKNIANVKFSTAGGDLNVNLYNANILQKEVNRTLYQIENTSKNWNEDERMD